MRKERSGLSTLGLRRCNLTGGRGASFKDRVTRSMYFFLNSLKLSLRGIRVVCHLSMGTNLEG